MNACLPQKLYLFNQDEYKNKSFRAVNQLEKLEAARAA